MREVPEKPEQQQSYFLGAVEKADESSAQWPVVLVGSTPIEFKVDMGLM